MEISLSFNELVFIDDNISLLGLEHGKSGKLSLEETGSESLRSRGGAAAVLGVTRNFILKIGSALLQLEEEEEKEEVNVDLDEKEMWLLRELSQSTVMVGKEPVGMHLKLKVHKFLRDFAAQEIIENMGFEDSEEHEIEKNDFQDKFIQWREKDHVE